MSLDEYMKKNIFDPCGAGSLTFYPNDENRKYRMTLCSRDDDGQVVPSTDGSLSRPMKIEFCPGGAGLYDTQKDYLVILRAILYCNPIRNHPIYRLYPSYPPNHSPSSFPFLSVTTIKMDRRRSQIWSVVEITIRLDRIT